MEYYTDDHNRCPKCGLPFWDEHKSTAVPNLCKCRADNHKWGWECPRCGRVKGTAKKSSWACPEAELVKINLEKHLTDSK